MKNALVDFYNKLTQNTNRNENGYILSNVKNKQDNPFLNVYPLYGWGTGYQVRIGLPMNLKEYACTRFGVWKEAGIPNGFSFIGFETLEQACEFYKSITEMSFDEFLSFLEQGDGSPRFYNSVTQAREGVRTGLKKANRNYVATDDRPADAVFAEITKVPAFKEALARFGQAAMIADRKVLTVNEYKLRYFAEAA